MWKNKTPSFLCVYFHFRGVRIFCHIASFQKRETERRETCHISACFFSLSLSHPEFPPPPLSLSLGKKKGDETDTSGRVGVFVRVCPTSNALLINFRLSLRCRNFVDKHRPSTHIGTKRARTCMQSARIPTELPFLHATVGGWVCVFCEEECQESAQKS